MTTSFLPCVIGYIPQRHRIPSPGASRNPRSESLGPIGLGSRFPFMQTIDRPNSISNSHGAYPPGPAAWSVPPGASALAGSDAESESRLLSYAVTILRAWPLLLVIGLASLALTVFVRSLIPPRFSSRTVLEVRSPNERFLNREAFDPRAMNSAIGAEAYLQTQLQIVESDQLIRNVLRRLAVDANSTASLAARLKVSPGELPGKERPGSTRAVDAVRGTIKAKVIPQTRLIEVVTTTTDPQFSAQLANAIAAQFLEEDSLAQRATLSETGKTLARELESVKRRLVASQEELNRYLHSAGLLVGGRTGTENMQESQLVQTQTELAAAQADRIRAQSRFEQIAQGDAQSLPDVVADTTLKDYRNQMATLRRELADLSTTLAPKHYRIEKLRAQIDSLERESAAYEQKILNKVRNEYSSATRRESLLQSAYQEAALRLADQTSKGFRYAQLRGEMDTNRQIYESMLARLKETEVLTAIGASNIRIVDQAYPAAKSNPPNLWQSGIIGLGAGLLLGAMLAVSRKTKPDTLSDAQQAAAYLGVNPLQISRAGKAPLLPQGAADLNGWTPAALESYAAVLASIDHPENENALAPASKEFGLEGGWARPGTGAFVVTSPGAGDGKTITTVGLGMALARNGKNVLLVNADFFQPKLQELFGSENATGLADLLIDGDLTHALDSIQPTAVSGLSVFPGGPAVGKTLQLFDSPALPLLVQKLRRQFDVILFDTPALMESADARLLAKQTDGVILVVRPDHTTKAEAMAARQRLSSFGLPITGVIMNHCPSKKGSRLRIRIRRAA